MRKIALALAASSVVVQLGWCAWIRSKPMGTLVTLAYPLVICAAVGALVLTRADRRGVNTAVRVLLGAAFGMSVADRFGLLGRAGGGIASWGDFPHFVAYTRRVNSFLPASWATALAAAATAAESALAVALAFGLLPRAAALAAALVVATFGAAMTASFGIGSIFFYAVPAFAAGCLLLGAAAVPARNPAGTAAPGAGTAKGGANP